MSDGPIGVLGLGRFGALWARELGRRWSVIGFDPVGAVDGVRCAPLEAVTSCRDIHLCTPISSITRVAAELAPLLQPGTVVLDSCSVKVHPCRVLDETLPSHVEIVGTHPLFGPDSAADGLAGRAIAVCPVRAAATTTRRWIGRFESMGLIVREMSPAEHDREAAWTQGLTHLVGRVLDRLELGPSSIGTRGYDALREIVAQTCRDSDELFGDLQRFNPFTPQMRDALERALDEVTARIAAGGGAEGA